MPRSFPKLRDFFRNFEQELAQVHADKKKLINDKKILQDKLLRQKKPKS